MKEVRIDISNQKSKVLTDDMILNSSPIVNMGYMDKNYFYSAIFLPKVKELNLEDPKWKSIEEVRKIRYEIEKRIKELVSTLEINQ